MTVKVQLSAVGINTTLFDIYSNFNNVTPIASGISKMALLAGYYLSPVPDGATTIRVVATGTCTNYTDMPISGLTTTTTTTATPTTTTSTTGTPTTTTTSSSTSTTSSSSTTTTTTTAALAIGQNYQGGIIAYLDGLGSGLIVSSINLGSVVWGCEGDFVLNLAGDYLGALDTTIYGGQLNTQEIVGPNGCATLGIAARICDSYSNGGYTDWYLANENEWFAIANSYVNPLDGIQNKDNPIFNFSHTSAYWSSNQSEINSSVAYDILLAAAPDDAIWASGNKNNTHLVRPIRKITI